MSRLTDEGPGAPRTLTFYRIVETNPPTVRDFLSQKARGRPLRYRTGRALRLWEGVSVYRSRCEAAALAGRSPLLGAFVAELRVPDDGSIRYELDNGPHGHCTVWGDAASLLALVVSVKPVEGVH